MTLIKSISGIRGTIGGVAGENLTPIDVVRFVSGYAAWLGEKTGGGKRLKVVVGRDARVSGEMLERLVEGTLMGCGADVIALGLCTTPGVEMAVAARGADGGIIITASHNPAEWNALKMLDGNGEFVSAADGARILELAAGSEIVYPPVDGLGHVVERGNYDDEHIDAVLALPLVDVGAVAARGLRVVVDAVNSVGGVVIPRLLERMGVEAMCINCEPTGRFAHDAEPLPENLRELSRRVVAERADLGVAVDPDVDRLALVCEDGTMFGEEYTLVAVADYVLRAHGGGNTVSNLSSTRALRDVTAWHGGSYTASAVGEVNVVAAMKTTDAVIGGEGNGGVIYPELHYGRDALVGLALFLTWLAHSGLKMTELRATYPEYHMAKTKIVPDAGSEPDRLLAALAERYSALAPDLTDGVKIEFPDSWAHIRRSNTEPIMRIYTEAPTPEEAQALAARIASEINR
ncbi:MAG: phosphoglucosamine mutase [Rikenellaceae bacterium]|nr:phosphoglucosamine mutase [Rikenellaceae bacterium]MCL2691845.1 phosphoglucosamine mutase [Rikenellaceae bacterium]